MDLDVADSRAPHTMAAPAAERRYGERSARPGRPWPVQLARELGIYGCGFLAYAVTYVVLKLLYAPGDHARLAIENGRRVVDLERWLHLFGEVQLQRVVLEHHWLVQAVNFVYLWLHLPLIAGIASWLYLKHRPIYVITRNAALICGGIALIIELVPVAPPYLLPELGLVNTAATRVYDVVEPKTFFDSYGAVPSIHVAWALLMGLAVWSATSSHWARLLAVTLPVLMSLAVCATGNHYVFDAITGVAVALVGLWAARRWTGPTAPRRDDRRSAGHRAWPRRRRTS